MKSPLRAFAPLLLLVLPGVTLADEPGATHAAVTHLGAEQSAWRAEGSLSGGIPVDLKAGTVEVQGTGAADPNAPNARVARVQAEHTARTTAARRLASALASLPHERLGCERGAPTEASIAAAAMTAELSQIDWASDGSVTLTLRLPLASLLPAPSTPRKPEIATTKPAVVEAPSATATLYLASAGRCVARPRTEASSSEEAR